MMHVNRFLSIDLSFNPFEHKLKFGLFLMPWQIIAEVKIKCVKSETLKKKIIEVYDLFLDKIHVFI